MTPTKQQVQTYDAQLETIAGFMGTPTDEQRDLTTRQLAWMCRFILHFLWDQYDNDSFVAWESQHPLGNPPS